MCRWGCAETDTTYMCKWCGTRYCKDCLRGDFNGLMKEPTHCRICNQKRCQGKRVEYVPKPANADDSGAKSARGRSTSRATTARSAKSAKGKKAGAKKSAKKSAKKKSKK